MTTDRAARTMHTQPQTPKRCPSCRKLIAGATYCPACRQREHLSTFVAIGTGRAALTQIHVYGRTLIMTPAPGGVSSYVATE